MLTLTGRILRALLILNWLAAAAFAVLIAVLATGDGLIANAVQRYDADPAALREALIGVLAIGIAAAVPVHIVFTRLIAMIDTVRDGHPFVAANAERLRGIAWGLLALQFLDLAFGWVTWRLTAATGEPIGWQFSLTGWLAVLLLFVLAGVFRQGAAMQDEIEGTV